jgi:O-methyltransferase domain/Dimerisation domain
MAVEPSDDKIVRAVFGFMAAKTLLSAIELGVFTELAKGALTLDECIARFDLHRRSARDFLDTLVAMGMLERSEGRYANTPETDYFLDRGKPTYMGGWLEMFNLRLYRFWGSLTEGLRTGQPQNEIKEDEDLFDAIYNQPDRLRMFLQSMSGHSQIAARAIARQFPWQNYQSFVDVGTAQGALPVAVATANPHLAGGGFDLPVVRPFFEQYVSSFGLERRLTFYPGDFFKDPLPAADVLVMGMILHDWNLDEKLALLRKAHEALPKGGALIVYELLIDDERRRNLLGLLMSLNMMIETKGGFDYSGADCCGWMREAGFSQTRVEQLTERDGMVVGIK